MKVKREHLSAVEWAKFGRLMVLAQSLCLRIEERRESRRGK